MVGVLLPWCICRCLHIWYISRWDEVCDVVVDTFTGVVYMHAASTQTPYGALDTLGVWGPRLPLHAHVDLYRDLAPCVCYSTTSHLCLQRRRLLDPMLSPRYHRPRAHLYPTFFSYVVWTLWYYRPDLLMQQLTSTCSLYLGYEVTSSYGTRSCSVVPTISPAITSSWTKVKYYMSYLTNTH